MTYRPTLPLVALLILLTTACSVLQPVPVAPILVYRLDAPEFTTSTTLQYQPASILIGHIRAVAGLDSNRMLYSRQLYQVEVFQQSQWQKAPAAMLMPLVTSALESSGQFQVVLQTPNSIQAVYRIDLEVTRLQQEFTTYPSHSRFSLRAYLSDNRTQTFIAWHEFDITIAAPSEDAYGGVIASNRAVALVMHQLIAFCTEQLTRTKK
ncbi:ABC-type transport auxiliary lipoprotein family protein [Undibacterium sp. SXout7W]|uniref:ABC-type transport auxiliary lipoprotein family protein n=1 Tax=Undibacterium sp. SXout7W TaxID=3413049 RepID=UPI003BF12A12